MDRGREQCRTNFNRQHFCNRQSRSNPIYSVGADLRRAKNVSGRTKHRWSAKTNRGYFTNAVFFSFSIEGWYALTNSLICHPSNIHYRRRLRSRPPKRYQFLNDPPFLPVVESNGFDCINYCEADAVESLLQLHSRLF